MIEPIPRPKPRYYHSDKWNDSCIARVDEKGEGAFVRWFSNVHKKWGPPNDWWTFRKLKRTFPDLYELPATRKVIKEGKVDK